MAQGDDSTRFHIVCSDQPRNGKTLVARLLCEYLILCRRTPLIFDASPNPAGLRSYFPARAVRIELSTATGQMALFDRALAQPQDCVVDLPAHMLTGAIDLMRLIGFGEKSHTPDLEVIVLFVADRGVDSLFAGRKLRDQLRPARFIIVRNEAILPADLDRLPRFLYDGLAKEGQLVLPLLDRAVAAAIEDRTFSFRRFAEAIPADMPHQVCLGIEDFYARVYRQFDLLGLGADSEPRAAAGN